MLEWARHLHSEGFFLVNFWLESGVDIETPKKAHVKSQFADCRFCFRRIQQHCAL